MYEVFEQLLQKHGVSPYKVSKDTGVTQTSLSNWKTGKSTPTTKTLQRLADYFGVTLDYLMTGKEEPKEKSPELTARDEKDITKTLNKVNSSRTTRTDHYIMMGKKSMRHHGS